MSHDCTLPPSVKGVVADFVRHLRNARIPTVRGIYLVGSIVLNDFRPGSSDIDFVAVLDGALAAKECDALAQIHAALKDAAGPDFDGFYLPAEALRRSPKHYAVVPFSQDGRFRTGEVCREINPVVWRCLARHGRTILGPPPLELRIADDKDTLRGYQINNLRTYWQSWVAQAEEGLAAKAPGEDANAAALAWGVLGVARIVCALKTEQVVSKNDGGLHALSTQPCCWHPIVCEAMAAHVGEMARVPVEIIQEGLAYMRFAIAEATAEPYQ